MEIEIFTVCHSATVENDRVSINRILNGLEVEFVPIVDKSIFVVVRLRLERHEFGRHKFDFSLQSPSGEQIPPHFSGSFGVSLPADFPFGSHTRIFNMSQVEFTEFGVYQFRFSVDGAYVFHLPFIVTKLSDETIANIAQSN